MLDLTNNPPSRRQNIYHLSIYLFFVASLAATVVAWLVTAKVAENRAKELFFQDSNNATTWIKTRFDTYSDILYGVRAFAENDGRITRIEWEAYVKRLQIAERYAGLRAIIYVQRVPQKNLKDFVAKLKQENATIPAYQNYTVHPETEKAEYFPVKYTHGVDLEQRYNSLGLDVTLDATRRETLDLARDTNSLTVSKPVVLAVNNPDHGFIVTLPVYAKDVPLDTTKDLRNALTGFVYAPFDANSFFDTILKPNWSDAFPGLDLEIYDDESTPPTELLYDKDLSTNLRRDPNAYHLTEKTSIFFGNKTWVVQTGLLKKDTLDPKFTQLPIIVFISGLLVSLFTFSILLRQYRRLQASCQQ